MPLGFILIGVAVWWAVVDHAPHIGNHGYIEMARAVLISLGTVLVLWSLFPGLWRRAERRAK